MNTAQAYIFMPEIVSGENLSGADRNKAISRAARGFVADFISRAEGVPSESLRFAAGEHGKPYIKGSSVHFNISHSGGLVLAAFCAEEIGADIEVVRDGRASVARRCFASGEKDYLYAAPDKAEENARFFQIWTAKEAFLKLSGVGLSGGFGFTTANEGGMLPEIHSEAMGRARLFCGAKKMEACDGTDMDCRFAVCGRDISGVELHYVSKQLLKEFV